MDDSSDRGEPDAAARLPTSTHPTGPAPVEGRSPTSPRRRRSAPGRRRTAARISTASAASGPGLDDRAGAESPGVGDLAGVRPGGQHGGLDGGPGGHDLVGTGHGDRPAGQGGQHLAVGGRAGAAPHQDQPSSRTWARRPRPGRRGPSSSEHTTPSKAARASASRLTSVRMPLQRAGGVGPVGRALAGQVRHQHQPVRAGGPPTGPGRRARRGPRRAAGRRPR